VNQVALRNSWIKWQRLKASFGFVPTAGLVGAWRASVDHNHSRSPVQRSSYRLRLIFPHPKHATSGLGLGTGTPTGDKVARKGSRSLVQSIFSSPTPAQRGGRPPGGDVQRAAKLKMLFIMENQRGGGLLKGSTVWNKGVKFAC
jgi:hypothetical protein